MMNRKGTEMFKESDLDNVLAALESSTSIAELNDKLGLSPDYAMFTDFGNDAVDAIVRRAKILNVSWASVEKDLFELSKREEFAEATDTAVRESVYIALGF